MEKGVSGHIFTGTTSTSLEILSSQAVKLQRWMTPDNFICSNLPLLCDIELLFSYLLSFIIYPWPHELPRPLSIFVGQTSPWRQPLSVWVLTHLNTHISVYFCEGLHWLSFIFYSFFQPNPNPYPNPNLTHKMPKPSLNLTSIRTFPLNQSFHPKCNDKVVIKSEDRLNVLTLLEQTHADSPFRHCISVIMFSRCGWFDHSSLYFSSAVRPGEHEEIVHTIPAGGHPELSQRKTTVRSGLVVFLILLQSKWKSWNESVLIIKLCKCTKSESDWK